MTNIAIVEINRLERENEILRAALNAIERAYYKENTHVKDRAVVMNSIAYEAMAQVS